MVGASPRGGGAPVPGRPPGDGGSGRGDADEALARVVRSTWRTLGRYHALVAINTQQHGDAELRERHSSVLAALEPLIARGQVDGTFRADVPAEWHLSMLLALIHAASGELRAGRITDVVAEVAHGRPQRRAPSWCPC